jgi:uncharacterized protein (TIGR04255 family)
MSALPTKLKSDAVEEALFEVRFETKHLGEVFVGRLASQFGTPKRLPAADVPLPVRVSNPDLKYQATLQAQASSGRVAKVGDRVFSYHTLAPYPGWQSFKSEIAQTIARVRDAIPDITPTRLGFRYVNVLEPAKHKIRSVADLNLSVRIAGHELTTPMNLNYAKSKGEQALLVRIATPEFVKAPLGRLFAVLIDVDVHQETMPVPDVDHIMDWVETAHTNLKEEFFGLLRQETVNDLREA